MCEEIWSRERAIYIVIKRNNIFKYVSGRISDFLLLIFASFFSISLYFLSRCANRGAIDLYTHIHIHILEVVQERTLVSCWGRWRADGARLTAHPCPLVWYLIVIYILKCTIFKNIFHIAKLYTVDTYNNTKKDPFKLNVFQGGSLLLF